MAFERSVRSLLELIKQRLHADSVTLRHDDELREQPATATLLRIPGSRHSLVVAFACGSDPGELARAAIQPLVEALSLVLARIEQSAKLQQLLMETVRLEWELADCKIAERSDGMLATGVAEPQTVLQHVVRVLRPALGIEAAGERTAYLQAELANRKQVAAAKQLLQRTRGFTESEAYLHLQRASRKTRRTIPEIARDVLASQDTGTRRIA